TPPILFPLQFSSLLPRLRGYDVIHAGNPYVAFPFCLFRRHFQAPVVHDMHGDVISEMLLMWKLNKFRNTFHLLEFLLEQRVAIHHSDYHLVVSRPLQELLLAHGVPRKKIRLIRNGVDTEMFRPVGVSQNGTFTVCYAGAYQAWQGVDFLIEAGQMLQDLDIKLKFMGFRETQYDRKWKEKIKERLGSKAELVDYLPLQELIRHLQAADILVTCRPHHPANVVSFSTKFGEYLALGKPVLVTDVEETAQFVSKYHCGLVYHPSASGLAEAIRQAYNMGSSRLRVMGERGRRVAETTFAWEVVSQEYYDFLTSIKSSSIQSIQ
ncbi:glycosyltransferase family 4 protein, partial [bacterium]|nr:glycosyltransferase family 4 protein [bacterium]